MHVSIRSTLGGLRWLAVRCKRGFLIRDAIQRLPPPLQQGQCKLYLLLPLENIEIQFCLRFCNGFLSKPSCPIIPPTFQPTSFLPCPLDLHSSRSCCWQTMPPPLLVTPRWSLRLLAGTDRLGDGYRWSPSHLLELLHNLALCITMSFPFGTHKRRLSSAWVPG